MANELDKSIEELEAEVIAELEEGAHDAPTKGAMKSEPMPKKPKDGATGEADLGGSKPEKQDNKNLGAQTCSFTKTRSPPQRPSAVAPQFGVCVVLIPSEGLL